MQWIFGSFGKYFANKITSKIWILIQNNISMFLVIILVLNMKYTSIVFRQKQMAKLITSMETKK